MAEYVHTLRVISTSIQLIKNLQINKHIEENSIVSPAILIPTLKSNGIRDTHPLRKSKQNDAKDSNLENTLAANMNPHTPRNKRFPFVKWSFLHQLICWMLCRKR